MTNPIAHPQQSQPAFADLIAQTANRLSHIWAEKEADNSNYAWEAAEYYVPAFEDLKQAWEREREKPLTAYRDVSTAMI